MGVKLVLRDAYGSIFFAKINKKLFLNNSGK